MRRLGWIAVLIGLLGPGACATKNIGKGTFHQGPQILEVSISPSLLLGGDTAMLTVSFTDTGSGPYTATIDTGGGASPEHVVLEDAISPIEIALYITSNDGGTFRVNAQITDHQGLGSEAEGFYSVGTDGFWIPHSITAVTVDADRHTVTVTAVGGPGPFGIYVSDIAGGTISPDSGFIPGGGGSCVFTGYAKDILAGAQIVGNVSLNPPGYSRPQDLEPFILIIDPVHLAADTLYALPMESQVSGGEGVRVTIATGALLGPFQFLNAVRVTAPAGFSYVADSFDIGAYVPGEDFDQVDGIWTAVNPDSFLTAPDSFIVETVDLPDPDSTGAAGRTGIDFNVTPLGGSDITSASGALFSFEATFGNGANRLAFQAVGGVDRTYYTDSNTAPNNYWADISNDHDGIPNSVVVN